MHATRSAPGRGRGDEEEEEDEEEDDAKRQMAGT
jgi:hypothetical protein